MRQIHQLRDVKTWEESGIKLSTPSDESAKLFDSAVSQFTGWYDDKQMGGLECTTKKMLDADPKSISGRSLVYCRQALDGINVNNNSEFKENIEQLAHDVEKDSTEWEKLQVNALQLLSMGNAEAALTKWEEILVKFPSDILSLHLAGMTCLIHGCLDRIRDISGRILPFFRDAHSLSTVHAWHSFGLGESNSHANAERHARIGLSLEPRSGWSTHALTHVFEMTSRYDDGIRYMTECESMWTFSNQIAGHNYWHWSLYYLTKGEFESAVDIFEQKLINRPGFDSLALSYLLFMEDSSVVDKHYERIEEIVEPYRTNHYRSLIDVRVMMGLCASKNYDEAEQFMNESIGSENIHGKNVNENLLRSILAYSREKYAECFELLWPIRFKIKQIGGSDAQRDVFNLMLINACLSSNKLEHKLLAAQLIEEREINRSKSPLVLIG